MGRTKLSPKFKRTALAIKVSPAERELLRRVAEAMGRELTLPANMLGASAALRMLVQREATRLGVTTATKDEE